MKNESEIINELKELEKDLQRRLKNLGVAIRMIETAFEIVEDPDKVVEKSILAHISSLDPADLLPNPPKNKTGVIAEKICINCNKPYKPTSNVQQRCEECRSKKVKVSIKPPE